MIPGPRGSAAPATSDRAGATGPAALLSRAGRRIEHNRSVHTSRPDGEETSPVSLVRTNRGWQVVSPAGSEPAEGLVEGLSLADLVAEELGFEAEPDRLARRSARGGSVAGSSEDPIQARIAALERTVAQLEHALAARVATERAIGVLAERSGTHPRTAFEALRKEARSSGRPVAALAREVLDGLEHRVGTMTAAPRQAAPPAPRSPGWSGPPTVSVAADGRS
jgi:hypothetical protein